MICKVNNDRAIKISEDYAPIIKQPKQGFRYTILIPLIIKRTYSSIEKILTLLQAEPLQECT